jgi:hypothetical protein
MAYTKTLELRRERKPSVLIRGNSRILQSLMKRELTTGERRRPEKRRLTEVKAEGFEGFNCTFARKLYSESS